MATERENTDLGTTQTLEQPVTMPEKNDGIIGGLTKHVRGIATACLGLLGAGEMGCADTSIAIPFAPETLEEESTAQPTEAFEKISVPERKLESGSNSLVEELKLMDQNEYSQQQSEGLLEYESETYQDKKTLRKMDMPEGNFSLDSTQGGSNRLGLGIDAQFKNGPPPIKSF